jgi:hypothetical protein
MIHAAQKKMRLINGADFITDAMIATMIPQKLRAKWCAIVNKPARKQDAMKNKKDFRVNRKCTAETYADHCRCDLGVVYGMHPCTFYEGGGECLNDKTVKVVPISGCSRCGRTICTDSECLK